MTYCFELDFRWWKEVQTAASYIEGVVYGVSFNDDADTEIVLELRKIDESGKSEEGFSGREYALITEATWVQALKRSGSNTYFFTEIFSIIGLVKN